MELSFLAALPPWEWPPDAGALILAALGDRKTGHDERLLAAELAGNIVVMNDEIARTLLSTVRADDEPPDLRGAAAIALGPSLEEVEFAFDEVPDGLGGTRWHPYDDVSISTPVADEVRGGLRDVYMDPEVPEIVRRKALEASIRCTERWHDAAVRAAYHSGEQGWRTTAVFCMGFVRGFEPEILEALESGNDELRYEAVRAAGMQAVEAAWPHVSEILRSPGVERPLLLAAIEALPWIRPDETASLLARLADSSDAEIAFAVDEALSAAELNLLDEEGPEP